MTNADNTVPTRVILAFGTMEIDAAVQRAVVAAAAGRCVLVAGLVFIGYRPSGRGQQWQAYGVRRIARLRSMEADEAHG
ncbi:MAG TPA: hypothetical protein VLA19_05435 [Herpetosiphonaceae bacterium]|nr:hypothetical protein [Herpetosiphonaceae bacterium]